MTHATDSTRSGCTANTSAAKAAAQSDARGVAVGIACAEQPRAEEEEDDAFAAWRSRLVR